MAKAKRYWEKKNDQGQLVARIDRKTKKGEYFLDPDSRQSKLVRSVEIRGFDTLPSGFYSSGAGITGAGYFLIESLYNRWDTRIRITIVETGDSEIKRVGKGVSLTLNHRDLRRLNKFYRNIRQAGTAQTRETVWDFLSSLSPSYFEPRGEDELDLNAYHEDELAELLSKTNIINNLSSEDLDALNIFIPQYVSSIPITLKSSKKLKVLFDMVDAGREVYLREVIAEFEKRLAATQQKEESWQKFLRKHILLLTNSYGDVLDKESVSLSGKFPDFMLIDPYNYLDIYEIKKPNTDIFKYDKSRSNYYWSTEIAKAISQIENYIHLVQRNSDSLTIDIRKSKNVDINIVRPRGYIVAGKRSMLNDVKMEDDFRILNESLKNVDILFYDDLLEGLKTFVSRISGTKSTSTAG